jgi:hypothetical protein
MTTPTFEAVSAINTDPYMLVAYGIVWFLPLFIYLLVGCVATGRSADGRKTSKPMIYYSNYWYSWLIWGLIQLGLILTLIIFPIWLKILE